MEALKFSFLDPDKTTDIHLNTVEEYEGASNERAFVKYGVLINTATALAPYLEQNGLDSWRQRLVEATQEKIANISA